MTASDAQTTVGCHVIAVVNGKGGVGKTSTTANLAGILAAEGYRVCAVDSDPQGNLGLDLGVHHAGQSDDGAELMRAAMLGEAPKPLSAVRPGLDVVSGGHHLEDLAAALVSRARSGRDGDTLTASLQALATTGKYDVVIIDCPPGGHAVQTSVLGAARWLLVPAKTDQASLSGLGEIARRFGAARVTNPQLQLLGVFLFDVGVTSRKVLREARSALSAALAGLPPETVLDVAIRHVEASAQAARAYGRLAHELEEEAAAAPRWYERRDGDDVVVIPKSASGLAGDYYALARAVLERIAVLSAAATAAADPAGASSERSGAVTL